MVSAPRSYVDSQNRVDDRTVRGVQNWRLPVFGGSGLLFPAMAYWPILLGPLLIVLLRITFSKSRGEHDPCSGQRFGDRSECQYGH